MANRLDLQNTLETILGSRNVYYQPPESVKMNYPAIRYSKRKPDIKRADNAIYNKTNGYEIIVISKNADDPAVGKIENLPMCEWTHHYIADNLHHDVLTLYF